MLTAVIAGLCGSIMSKYALRFMVYKSAKRQADQWILVAACGLAIALIAFFSMGRFRIG